MSSHIGILVLVNLLGGTVYSTVIFPFAAGINITEYDSVYDNSTEFENNNTTFHVVQIEDRLRQDVDGGAAEGIGQLAGIGTNLGHILSGVYEGNLKNIFKGATGFIEEDEAREAVSGILNGLERPLSQALGQGLNYTKKYLGITSPSPLGANGTMAIANNTLQASTPKIVEEDTEVPEPPGPPPDSPSGTEEDPENPEDGSESDVDDNRSFSFKNINNITDGKILGLNTVFPVT